MEDRNLQCMVRAIEWLNANDRIYIAERYSIFYLADRDLLVDLHMMVDCYTGQKIQYLAENGAQANIKLNLNA